MAIARCSKCDMNYPRDVDPCPMCGHPTWQDKSEDADWDTGWRNVVERYARRHVEGQPIPNADVPVVTKEGKTFVADALLLDAGYHDLETDSIIKVRGKFYEIQGAMYRNSDSPAWWIEEVDRKFDIDHPLMTGFDYDRLEERRGLRT